MDKLTDQEVLASFMEPRPRNLSDPGSLSVGLWWWMGAKKWEPSEIDLDACHEIEARLDDGQWRGYERSIWGIPFSGPVNTLSRVCLHADAKRKVKALAVVLRPIVEAK